MCDEDEAALNDFMEPSVPGWAAHGASTEHAEESVQMKAPRLVAADDDGESESLEGGSILDAYYAGSDAHSDDTGTDSESGTDEKEEKQEKEGREIRRKKKREKDTRTTEWYR